MGYPILYITPGGIMEGTEIPRKDNPLFGFPGSPNYRPGQALSMGGPLGNTEPEFNALGISVFHTPSEHLDVFETGLKNKRHWDEATQTVIVNTAKDAVNVPELINRFTPTEREDLFTAEVEGTPPQQRKLRAFFGYLRLQKKVDPDMPYIINSINYMEAQTLIGVGRAAEILF